MSCVHACIHWTMCPVARAHNEMHRVRRFTRGQSQLVPSPYSACNEYRSAIASPFHSAFVWSPSSTINYPSRRVAMSRSPRSQLYHSRGKTDSSRGQDYHFSDRSCTSLVSLRLIVSPCVSSCRGPRARIGRISLSIDASDRNEPISLLYDVSFRLFRKTFPFVFFFFIGKASSKSTFNYLSFNWFTIVVRIRKKRKVTILLDFVVWLILVVYVLHSTRIS